MPGRDYKII